MKHKVKSPLPPFIKGDVRKDEENEEVPPL